MPRTRSAGPTGGLLPRSVLLLGAGELGKELAISAQRLGIRVVAADRYSDAPAMQVAHAAEVVSLLDGAALEGVVRTHQPDLIVPEVEAVSTEKLERLETDGFQVVPSAAAAALVRSREVVRRVAHDELGLATPRYVVAATRGELLDACEDLGYPSVVKPLVSFSGRGQSVVSGPSRVERAWVFAQEPDAEEERPVMVEELVEFEMEVTLLAVREWDGKLTFLPPIAHRQERGAYRESWTPGGPLVEARQGELQEIARRLTERLGGAGVFGLEFYLTKDGPIFAELSLGPHDTGMVTMISQDVSQFDFHLRAVLGLPMPALRVHGPSASAVILADGEGAVAGYRGVAKALQVETSQLRIFGKPQAHVHRRMGVALASGGSVEEARARALEAASRVTVEYV